MTLCQLVKAIDDFNGKFGIGWGQTLKTNQAEVGLLILKQLENLSDERVVLQFKLQSILPIFGLE
jgi:hypothetical protein